MKDVFLKMIYNSTWKITWPSQWFTLFVWKNEIWKSCKTCSQFPWQKEYVIHIWNLKQALNHALVVKKVHWVINHNQEVWLKAYIDMNRKLKKWKNVFEKKIFKLVNNAVFVKTMENVRNHRDIKLITTEVRRNYFVSEPNYHSANIFSDNLLAIDIIITQARMNKLVYLGLSKLEISKILTYELWYDNIKQKYGEHT